MVQKKKHLLMLTGDSGIAYGKQNVFFEMLRGFSEHFERISIICPSNEIGSEIKIHKNVYLYPSPYKKHLHLDFFRHKKFIVNKALDIYKQNPFDAIISHMIPPFFAATKAAIVLSKKFGVRHFSELHHVPGYPKSNSLLETLQRLSLHLFFFLNYKHIGFLRVVNKSETYKYVVDRLKFPAENILYIPSFYLDFDLFKPGNTVRNYKQFVFCGRLEKNKGIDLLLDAAYIVAKKVPDFKLKIIGDGSMKDFVQKRTNKNIKLLGWLPTRRDVARVYQESAGMIMTSYNEGGPRVTLEAMACGTLCISTKVGVMNEVVDDGKNALFIRWDANDIAEKILWAIKNPDNAARVAEEGRKSVQKFEYNQALKFYADTCLKIAELQSYRVTEKRKKLVFVLPEYDENTSTHYNYLIDLLEEVAKEMEVFLFIEYGVLHSQNNSYYGPGTASLSGTDGKNKPCLKNIQHVYLQKIQIKGLNLIERFFVFLWLRLRGYKRFYVHYSYFSAILVGIISRLTFAKSFVWYCEQKNLYKGGSIAFRMAIRCIKKVVTCTELMAGYYREFFHLSDKHLAVMHNWVDVNYIKNFKPTARRDDKKTVLFVHWLSPRKGSEYLPEIIKKTLAKTDCRFVIVGDGPDISKIREIANENLEVVGAISNREIYNYYKNADVFIMPSREEEFGRVLVEAMACGLPIVAMKTLGTDYILNGKQKNFIVPQGDTDAFSDKIVELLKNDELRQEMSEVGLKRVKDFDKVLSVKRFIEIVA